jgi:hypothetical protein
MHVQDGWWVPSGKTRMRAGQARAGIAAREVPKRFISRLKCGFSVDCAVTLRRVYVFFVSEAGARHAHGISQLDGQLRQYQADERDDIPA